jgi:pimeloyl-ACP methyl ester carboxylesterase
MVTYCLIHGNWHDGSSWTPLVERLTGRGHRVLAPDLPFDDPNATYEQRAQSALDALDGAADPVVVVGHSVGSAEAALVASQGRVALLVYLCPRLGSFPVGDEAPAVFREGFPFPPTDDEGGMVWQPSAAINTMYPRLAPSIAEELASRLRPGAFPKGDYPLTAPPDVPSALIYTSDASSSGQSGSATPPTTCSASNRSKCPADTSQCKNTQTSSANISTASRQSTLEDRHTGAPSP